MKLYAILTNHCNLSCSHCFIRNKPEEYNRDKFIYELNKFNGKIILFGGEPTFHRDRFLDIINNTREYWKSKALSITTNLVNVDNELLEIYKEIKFISTSWNYKRFTEDQYEIWRENCNRLETVEVKCTVLITLTQDLIDLDVQKFLSIVDQWNKNTIEYIRFEHVIDDNNDIKYYYQVDKWLSNLYQNWRSPIKVDIFDKYHQWYYQCNDIYTLLPNGNLFNKCPNGVYISSNVLSECFTCDKAHKCCPCRLQKYCSYPKQLKSIIERRENIK